MVYLCVVLFVHLCRVSDGIQAKSVSQKRNQDMATKSGFESVSIKYDFSDGQETHTSLNQNFCIMFIPGHEVQVQQCE